MKQEEIDKIRKKYPLPFEEISLYNSFEQILGRKPEDYTPEERKARWDKIMSFNKNMKEYWSDGTACEGCIYLEDKDAWCKLQKLPCTVNPILSYRYGMIGMACYGAGKRLKEPTLFDNKDFQQT